MMYGDPNAQRNAITQALVNNVSPAPRTPMPDPMASLNATYAMPGRQPLGLANQARVAPTPLASTPVPAQQAPGALPPMGMPLMGQQPLIGQQPLVSQPGTQLLPQGLQPRTY